VDAANGAVLQGSLEQTVVAATAESVQRQRSRGIVLDRQMLHLERRPGAALDLLPRPMIFMKAGSVHHPHELVHHVLTAADPRWMQSGRPRMTLSQASSISFAKMTSTLSRTATTAAALVGQIRPGDPGMARATASKSASAPSDGVFRPLVSSPPKERVGLVASWLSESHSARRQVVRAPRATG
jgi:hypothetical protein